MPPSEQPGLPPLTLKEFIQRLSIVGGIVSTFVMLAVIVIWLMTPALAAQ